MGTGSLSHSVPTNNWNTTRRQRKIPIGRVVAEQLSKWVFSMSWGSNNHGKNTHHEVLN